MNLALCVLIAVIALSFLMLVLVSGMKFKFTVNREGFQNGPNPALDRDYSIPAPASSGNGGAERTTYFTDLVGKNVDQVVSIDETPETDRMSLFHKNECSPRCCTNGRGNYSCSTGCVCVSDKQMKVISSRGNNHNTVF